MTVNVNPNYDPNVANNELYNTQIPALSENANIQEALRVYHYGVGTGLPTTNSQIQEQSVAGHLRKIRTDLTTLQNKGVGSSYTATEPTAIDNGFIWVNANSSAPIFNSGVVAVANYQNTAPTVGLVDGMLWVDKDSSPLKLYVYDAGTTSWKEIGA
jgi:hypothetical protein